MTRTLKILLIIFSCLQLCLNIHNPGIVVQIPNNMSLPIVPVSLPQDLPPITIQKLQLTNIKFRQIQYKWKISGEQFIVFLQRTLVSFDWIYGRDSGVGTFQQQYCDLIVKWSIATDSGFRFKLEIDAAKITNQDKRHSISIKLGGNVPQTLTIIITNIILNHAKVIFRAELKNIISKVVESFTQPLRKDPKIICKNQSQQYKQNCIYLNTTLVNKPFMHQNLQFLQINASPYKSGTRSGYLDPAEVMIKVNSSRIVLQFHQQLVNRFLSLYQQIFQLEKVINSTQISSTIEINSQYLTVFMPQMKKYIDPRPVIMTINVSSIQTVFSASQMIQFKINCTLKVQTYIANSKSLQPYSNKTTGQFSAKIRPNILASKANILLSKLKVNIINFDDQDVKNNLVNPSQITRHLTSLMEIVKEAVNGGLYQKIINIQFQGIHISPQIKTLTNSLAVQIIFI